MVLGSNFCLLGDQRLCSGFEYLTFWGVNGGACSVC
jgi:hypothetical protein